MALGAKNMSQKGLFVGVIAVLVAVSAGFAVGLCTRRGEAKNVAIPEPVNPAPRNAEDPKEQPQGRIPTPPRVPYEKLDVGLVSYVSSDKVRLTTAERIKIDRPRASGAVSAYFTAKIVQKSQLLELEHIQFRDIRGRPLGAPVIREMIDQPVIIMQEDQPLRAYWQQLIDEKTPVLIVEPHQDDHP